MTTFSFTVLHGGFRVNPSNFLLLHLLDVGWVFTLGSRGITVALYSSLIGCQAFSPSLTRARLTET